MTYLRPHNVPGQRARRTTAAVLLGVGAFVALIQWLAPYAFQGLFMSITQPFWQAEFSINSGALRTPAQILAENESLKRQLGDIQIQMASSSVGMILQENLEFKAQLGRASTTPRILAAVLSRPPFAPYDELILDVGQDKKVSSTTLVYAPGNVLIGRVRESFGHSSKVVLFTSPGQTYQVTIGSTHIPATATGQGGGQYRAEVPHGAYVQVGDSVSDSSLNDGSVGMVVSITTNPANPFDSVYIAPTVNLYQLRWVYLSLHTSSHE